MSHDHTWAHMMSHDHTWPHMVSHDVTWSYIISRHMISHMISHDVTWSHMVLHWCRLYQCPLCYRSMTDMTKKWEQMDKDREEWQMPFHLRNFLVKVQTTLTHKFPEMSLQTVTSSSPESTSSLNVNVVNLSEPHTNELNGGFSPCESVPCYSMCLNTLI